MVFDQAEFLFRFLPGFIILYLLTPKKLKNILLILGGIFCALKEPFALSVMLPAAFLDFVYGFGIAKTQSKFFAKFCVAFSVLTNVFVLVFFTYADRGLPANAVPLIGGGESLNMVRIFALISMGYVIDVYRGKVQMETNLLHYGTAMTLFPLMAVGPVVPYRDLKTQLRNHPTEAEAAHRGLLKFLVGLAKKTVLAGQMWQLWQEVAALPEGYFTTGHAWLGALAFAFCLYFTVSGYTDMAVGLGMLFGFSLPENFDYPILSDSVTAFFQRYGMSWVRWFKEYVYALFAQEDSGFGRRSLARIVTWVLLMTWARGGENGPILGLLFGLWMVLEDLIFLKLSKLVPYTLKCILTYVIILIGAVLFALPDLGSALHYVLCMFGYGRGGIFDNGVIYTAMKYVPWLVLCAFCCLPLGKNVFSGLEKADTGGKMGLYRVTDKLAMAVLLFGSMVYLFGRG